MTKRKQFNISIAIISIVSVVSCQLKRIEPPTPTIESLNPDAAKFDSIVAIKGTGFVAHAKNIYKVNIGDTAIAAWDVPNETTLIFKVPKGKSGPVSVTVNGESMSTSNAKNFTYYYTATKVSKLMGGMNLPAGLDVDIAGNVVVADRGNNLIKVIKPATDISAGGEIIKIHGNGSAGCNSATIFMSENANFRLPADIDVDPVSGNIYVPEESSNAVIRRIKPDISSPTIDRPVEVFIGSCGISQTQINTVPRLDARLNLPTGFASDGSDFYFTDAGGIKKLDAFDKVSVLTPKPTSGYFRGIAVSRNRVGAGPIFVTDEMSNTIKSVNEGGTARNLEFNPNNLGDPVALTVDSHGNIFVVDKGKHQVFVIYHNGVLRLLAGTGEADYNEGVPGELAKFKQPTGIAIDENKGAVYVSDSQNQVVRAIKIE